MMDSIVKSRMMKRLHFVYGEDSPLIFEDIEKLIASYRGRISVVKTGWSEKDSFLISYADWASGVKKVSERTTFLNITATHDGIGVRPTEGILSIDRHCNDVFYLTP